MGPPVLLCGKEEATKGRLLMLCEENKFAWFFV